MSKPWLKNQTIQAAWYEEDEPQFQDEDHEFLLKTRFPDGVKEHERLLAIYRKKQAKEKNPCSKS